MVVSAFYGADVIQGINVTSIVREKFLNKKIYIEKGAMNELFGDPVKGKVKTLIVRLDDGTVWTGTEETGLHVSLGYYSTATRVVSAYYGITDSSATWPFDGVKGTGEQMNPHWAHVSSYVNDNMKANNGSINLNAGSGYWMNTLFGNIDPVPNVQKTIILKYKDKIIDSFVDNNSGNPFQKDSSTIKAAQ